MKEKLLWGLFVVMGACATAALVGYFLRGSPQRRVPDFALVERGGKPLTRRDLAGEVWVGQFIFTRCAGSCLVMVSRMSEVHKEHPAAKYVSFSVDPVHDTPEVLARFATTRNLPAEWLFATGTYEQMQSLAKDGFQLSMAPGSDPKEPIIHSDRFALVDRYGRIRGTYSTSDPAGMAALDRALQAALAERTLPVHRFPFLNMNLNAGATFFILLGFILIKARRIGAHKASMLAALACSSLFLVGYLTAHYYLGSTPYPGQGAIRTLYLTILLTHTVLAALIVPLVGITLYRAFAGQFDRHKGLARWTLPLWLYVSVTGVVIYFMLY